MSRAGAAVEAEVLAELRLSAYDLPTRDKIPVIRGLLAPGGEGLALDIGLGTGYTTYRVFGDRPTVCVDIDQGNLRLYRERLGRVAGARPPFCVAAAATALPFRAGAFRWVLASEVFEHLEDDDGAAAELARVLAPDGVAIVTVPTRGSASRASWSSSASRPSTTSPGRSATCGRATTRPPWGGWWAATASGRRPTATTSASSPGS